MSLDNDAGGKIPAGADAIPVHHASVAQVVDRGEEVWCLLIDHTPAPDGVVARPQRWVVFPRSGFMASLVAAIDRFLPGADCPGQPDTDDAAGTRH